MLVIRLLRSGKKNQPFFKIVVTDKRRSARGGRFTEQVGFYNPLTKEKNIKKERVQYWLGKGARPSDTINNLLVSGGVIKGRKVAVHPVRLAKPLSNGVNKKPKGEKGPGEAPKPEPQTEKAPKETAPKTAPKT